MCVLDMMGVVRTLTPLDFVQSVMIRHRQGTDETMFLQPHCNENKARHSRRLTASFTLNTNQFRLRSSFVVVSSTYTCCNWLLLAAFDRHQCQAVVTILTASINTNSRKLLNLKSIAISTIRLVASPHPSIDCSQLAHHG